MSYGILGDMFSGADARTGTGILGGGLYSNAPKSTGISLLDGLHNFTQDNQNALLQMGASLLDGDGWGGGFKAYANGMQQDQRTRLLKQAQAKEEQKAVEARKLAAQYGLPTGMDADPDRVFSLVGQIEASKRTRQPTEWDRLTEGLSDEEVTQAKRARLGLSGSRNFTAIGEDAYGNKIYGWVDERKGTIEPYQGAVPGAVPSYGSSEGAPESGAAIPPPPPGADPKTWRTEQTRLRANEGKPTEKQRTDVATAERMLPQFQKELKLYNALVQRYGTESFGPTKARMKVMRGNILMMAKDLYALGALQQGDIEQLEKIIPEDATSGWANPFPSPGIGGRVDAQTEELDRIATDGVNAARRSIGGGGSRGGNGGGNVLRFDAQGNVIR